MDITLILTFAVVILFGYFIKSVSGFAGAVISVGVLSLWYDLTFIVPVITLVDVMAGLSLLPHARAHINKRMSLLLLVGLGAGTALGVTFLTKTENMTLQLVFGVVVLLFAFTLFVERYIKLPVFSRKLGPLFGFAGGLTGGLFSANGPPVAIYLSYAIKDKLSLRSTLITVFLVDGLWRAGLLALTGLLTKEVVFIAMMMIPVVVVSSFLGEKLCFSISESTYRKGVGALLAVTGVILIL